MPSNTSSRRTRGWFLALSVACLAQPAAVQCQQRGPMPPKVAYSGVVELPMKMRGALPAVDVMVNGQGPFVFMVDLGSSGYGRADASLVKRLNLPVVGEAGGADGPGGARRAMPVVRMDSLAIGSMRLEGLDAPSRDYNTGALPPIDGVLCLDLFHGMVITLDYPAQKIRIERGQLPEPNGQTIFAAESGRRNIVVPLSVGGKTVPAVLDTGNSVGLLLPASFVKDLPKAGEPKSAGKARSVSGEYDVMQVELAEPVRLGNHSLGTTVRYYDQLQMGNIGSQELSGFRVSFDPANNRVRIAESGAPAAASGSWQSATPATNPVAAPQSPRRYGIQMMGISADEIAVAGTEPGSAAERGGLRAGDKILAMNGKPLNQLSEAERVQALRGSPLVLSIEREGKNLELRLTLDAPPPALSGSATTAISSRILPPAGATVLPLDFYRNVPVVEVMLNGRGPYRMFLDTGAQGSVLDDSLVKELQLPVVGETSITSPGGQPIPAKRVQIENIKLGDFTKAGVTAIEMDRSRLGNGPEVPRGVLSANSLFAGSTITLNYPAKQVWVAAGELPVPDQREIFGYGADERLPVVPLRIAGKEMLVHLDSGAPSAVTLPMARAAELPLEAPPVVIGRGRRVDREVVIYGAKLRGTLQLGRFTFENPELRFDESVTEYGTVGFGILKDFVVTLDNKNRRIRLVQ